MDAKLRRGSCQISSALTSSRQYAILNRKPMSVYRTITQRNRGENTSKELLLYLVAHARIDEFRDAQFLGSKECNPETPEDLKVDRLSR